MATILVVDDEPDIRTLVQLNLELDGHRVLTAANGAEALTVLDVEVPDLMLLDLMMPEVDGWKVLEAVKAAADPDIKQIPVLMLTAFDTAENRVRGGIEGAIRYLRKPFSPTELRQEINDALSGDPEPDKRRRVQQAALEQLARMEKGLEGPGVGPRPHLTRMERPRPAVAESRQVADVRARLAGLTPKQSELLERLAGTPSVTESASALGVSRSNVYASLRRISRKLGVGSVPELLEMVRHGDLLDGR